MSIDTKTSVGMIVATRRTMNVSMDQAPVGSSCAAAGAIARTPQSCRCGAGARTPRVAGLARPS
jgi:hypothetical protein